MISKTKTRRSSSGPAAMTGIPVGSWSTPPWTMEERVVRIAAMGRQIDAYVIYMCQVAGLTNVSVEEKEKAVTAFYEQMVVVARQLGHIQESFRLE